MTQTNGKSCVKCPKGPGQVTCDGCEQRFCMKHLAEHRQELGEQLDELNSEKNQLQQHLTEESNDEQHPLITRVNQWESRSIERIKQVADEVRSKLTRQLNVVKNNIRESLNLPQISRELEESRQTDTFTETELKNWSDQLKRLREEFDKPAMVQLVDEDGGSSTHISLLQLQIFRPLNGKDG